MNTRALFVVSLLVLSACFPKGAPPPTALNPKQLELAQAKSPDVTNEALERGRVLFVDKCGACHDHPDLTAVRMAKWPDILTRMIENAELTKDAAASSELRPFVMTAAEAAGAKP